MNRAIAFVVTMLVCWAAASPVHAQADRTKTIEELHKKSPPIVFFIAHGSPDSCGPGCDTWIAGDGRFDDDAPAHFRRVLEQAGKRKLPVYFQSPGGGMREAIQIGHMLRSRGLTAGIARTLPQGCWPAKPFDVCSKAMQEKPAESAALVTIGASCVSACPFALIGAVTREIDSVALVGVHEGLAYFKRSNGVSSRRLELALHKLESKWDSDYASYIAEMKIDKGLFAIVRQTPFEKVRYLTRAELFEFGIDRREALVSGWNASVLDLASIGYAVYTKVTMRPNAESGEPKPMTLALSCAGPAGGYLLTSLQPVSNTSIRRELDFVVNADRSSILLTRTSSFLTTNNDQVFEVRRARVSRGVLDALLTATTVTLSGEVSWVMALAQPASSGITGAGRPYEKTPISTLGAAEALRAIVARCERT